MWTIHIQKILTEIEEDILLLGKKFKKTIVYNEDEIHEYETSLRLVDEFRTLIIQMKWDPDDEEDKQFNFDGTPIIGGLVAKLGWNALGKLVREIANEIKEKRAADRDMKKKEHDDKHTQGLVDGVKGLEGETEIKLTPPHGTKVDFKHKTPPVKSE